MRRSRGNIILTALFIAIFLFFLSVALIWTNRQDIALSLSMEHKLKAQTAARSAAYEAYYRLRRLGELGGFPLEGTLDSGAGYVLELVSLEPLGRRGKVLQVKARGKSGPVTSYLTLHLLETAIAGEENSGDSRVMFFPAAPPASEETEETESDSEETGSETEESTESGKALFGEFTLEEGGPGLVPGMKAAKGPAFVSEPITIPETELPSFLDNIPAYGGPFLRAWGPVEVVAPLYPTGPGGSPTEVRYLKYSGEQFEWEKIDPPTNLGSPPPEGATGDPLLLIAPDNSQWTTSSVLVKSAPVEGEDDEKMQAFNIVWTEQEPPTLNEEDIEDAVISPGELAGTLIDWPGTGETQQKFETRGTICPSGNVVYSHGWHLLYQPHDGSFPDPYTIVDGSTLTRWPCILKYTIEGEWEIAWAGLKDDGSVESEHRPDPNVLLATTDGTLFGVTEPGAFPQRRLLTFQDSGVTLGDPVPDGQIILYQDEPYLIQTLPAGSAEPALLNLVSDGKDIDFSSLPSFLPEINGEVVDVTGTEMLILGIEGGYTGEALDSTKKLGYTASPRYDFTYGVSPTGQVAVDDDDLWAVITIDVQESEPTLERGYEDSPYEDGQRTTLARYDGERWHILPNGLRACLDNSSLGAPGAGVVAALYPGLPPQVSRYTIISEDTNPF